MISAVFIGAGFGLIVTAIVLLVVLTALTFFVKAIEEDK